MNNNLCVIAFGLRVGRSHGFGRSPIPLLAAKMKWSEVVQYNNFYSRAGVVEYVPISRFDLERRIKKGSGLQTTLSTDQCDAIFQSIAVAAKRANLQSARDIKTTFSHVNHNQASGETVDVKEKVDHFMPMLRALIRKAKFTELSSLEKFEILGNKSGRPKLSESRLSSLLVHAVLEYVSPRMEVDARVKRFNNICFWVRGSKVVPGKPDQSQRFVQMVFGSIQDEEYLLHRQVIMLLIYKDHDLELRGYRDVAAYALNKLITGGVVRLKKMDFFLLSSALTIGFMTFCMQKIWHIGVNRHLDITWQWTLMIASAIAIVSGYFNLSAKRHIYYRRLAESNHEKLIASDDALLTYLHVEAEEEIIKEALLTLVGILKRTARQEERLTVFGIENNATDWLHSELDLPVTFRTSSEALEILEQTRLIVRSKHFFDLSHNSDIDVSASLFPVIVHEIVS